MFLCTVPFEILDAKYFGDYLFSIWGTGAALLLIFFIMSASLPVKKWRKLCRGDSSPLSHYQYMLFDIRW